MESWKDELDKKYEREMSAGSTDKMDRANRIILQAISQLDGCNNLIKIKTSQGLVLDVKGLPEGYLYEIVECDKCGEPLPAEEEGI